MDSSDKKMKSIMEQALKGLILPRLDKIEKKLDATFDAVGETKVEMTILSSTTRRQDDFSIKADQLNRRVLKLETKKV